MKDAPSYHLRLEPHEHHLYAHVAGPEDTVEISIAYWSEIEAACRAGNVQRLLVVEELEGNATQAEMSEVVEGLLHMGFRAIRIAYVDATEDASLLVSAEIRAQQAGLVARVFRREDEATRWLLSDLADGSH